MVIIVLGVSASGKTTIGQMLARELGLEFYDADDFHSEASREKMRHGIPLTDADRAPWLEKLSRLIDRLLARQTGAVLACSALKQAYRDRFTRPDVQFVFLRGSFDLIRSRLAHRAHHFFDPQLLRSQFETLEEPEDALTVEIDATPRQIVDEIKKRLGFSARADSPTSRSPAA
jgi:gluconokinase